MRVEFRMMAARNVRDTPDIHRNINDKLSNMSKVPVSSDHVYYMHGDSRTLPAVSSSSAQD